MGKMRIFEMKLVLVLSFLSFSAMAGDIPKTAVQTAPGTYNYTDAHGKKWIFRATPFGVTRIEDRPAAQTAGAAQPDSASIKAVEAGDFIRFERQGPFGVYKWQTKKSELTAAERSAWEKSRTKKD